MLILHVLLFLAQYFPRFSVQFAVFVSFSGYLSMFCPRTRCRKHTMIRSVLFEHKASLLLFITSLIFSKVIRPDHICDNWLFLVSRLRFLLIFCINMSLYSQLSDNLPLSFICQPTITLLNTMFVFYKFLTYHGWVYCLLYHNFISIKQLNVICKSLIWKHIPSNSSVFHSYRLNISSNNAENTFGDRLYFLRTENISTVLPFLLEFYWTT